MTNPQESGGREIDAASFWLGWVCGIGVFFTGQAIGLWLF